MKELFKKLFKEIGYWFVPEDIQIADGTVVKPPRPITPYIIIVVVLLTVISAISTDFSVVVILRRFLDFRRGPLTVVRDYFPVDWSYWTVALDKILETIQMAFLGSLVGSLMSLPVAYFASKNITTNKVVVAVVRLLMSALRTIPILVYATFLTFMFWSGAFPGTVAIAIFTFSIVTKMLYERIEAVDMGAFHAIQSTGASKVKSFISAVMPNVLPIYLSLSLYAFEINIRYAAILGFVGAGGIGLVLMNAMQKYYDRVIVLVLFIFVVVILIENTSRYLRKRLG